MSGLNLNLNLNIKNSINVPLKDLMYRVNEFSKEKKYITVCAIGMRAESAKKFFEKKKVFRF